MCRALCVDKLCSGGPGCLPTLRTSCLNRMALNASIIPHFLMCAIFSIPIRAPPSTPSCRLLLTLELFHLPRPRLIRLLQPLHAPYLLRTRLTGHHVPPRVDDQLLQLAETRVDVVVLLATVVGLYDDVVGFGGVVA